MDLCFSVNKLEKFSSNTGRLHFDGLVHLLRHIKDNKNLGCIHDSNIDNAPIYDLLRQSRINYDNQLMML